MSSVKAKIIISDILSKFVPASDEHTVTDKIIESLRAEYIYLISELEVAQLLYSYLGECLPILSFSMLREALEEIELEEIAVR